ncbi:PhnD/SsuA/transferrin family substrate-binding protein [Tabrizicola sp.]|uniref:phosphate/phosphite/phosphonate ABC transporter substrate-binding protein n=1 Tax=Tabrizicola sp. TaxID=2005166 RepID=UPI001A5FE9B7|nr:PhnD/SsuA/transferrin family substrate-binding protein [Tabrizicola sp.]MBL9064571.1 PhnD/SsuA/transferrin family substrate-binding protein [Tabrizicola sp.]
MIASLGMYDFGPAQAANDRLWALVRDGLRTRGIAAPETLTRGEHAYWDAWQSPHLILSQTCGYPFRARLHDRVTYVGTPDYGVDGCPPGYYRSVFVARADDPRETLADFDGARFAYNEALSQSGWAAPQTHAAKLGIRLPPTLQSGGHRLSALAVAEGRADIAALDAVTHAMLREVEPQVAALRVLALTDPTPGLPYISAASQDPEPVFDALAEAIAALSAPDRTKLRLKGLVRIPRETYLAVPNPPSPEQIAAAG